MTTKLEPPSGRTLERDIPELKEFLRPGMTVLDVGCGPGTITVDVAAAVSPGKVVGLDPSEESLTRAREWHAEHPDIENLCFQVGDSHSLDFEHETFDLVYSHTALHFFIDSVRGLREQARVTRKGGWVIASGVRDHLHSVRYPDCPHWFRVEKALYDYLQSQRERLRSALERGDSLSSLAQGEPTSIIYLDVGAGRKCPSWFSEAGLESLQVKAKAEHLQFPGSEYMNESIWDHLPLHKAESASERQLELWFERAIAAGLLDRETFARAREEARAWYQDPRAFNFWVLVFVAGRV